MPNQGNGSQRVGGGHVWPCPLDRPEGKGAYTLADAMRDAIWRKSMADKLKTLLSVRAAVCANGAKAGSPSSSTGFGSACPCPASDAC